MDLDVTSSLEKIDFGARGISEILQNIKVILSTTKYSVPLDRKFGISAIAIDEPLPVAQAKISGEIIEAIREYEPRARVLQVGFEANVDGILYPKVRVSIDEQFI